MFLILHPEKQGCHVLVLILFADIESGESLCHNSKWFYSRLHSFNGKPQPMVRAYLLEVGSGSKITVCFPNTKIVTISKSHYKSHYNF